MKLSASIFFGLLFLGSLSCSGPGRTDQKPNTIFILVDDLGWADLGCYGSLFHETPNIDRLAGQGMKFTSAYAACPVCSPTRASMIETLDENVGKLMKSLEELGLEERPIFWHYPHYSNQGGKPGAAIRMGDLKLIEFFEDNSVELYNLSVDPGFDPDYLRENYLRD